MKSEKHIFNIGDMVVFDESIEGVVTDVTVNQENNTEYIVNFINGTCARFLAKDLKLYKEDEQ